MNKILSQLAPHSKESEMMVLGCMLSNADSFRIASEELDDFDFYFKEHKIIFSSLKNSYRNHKPADIHLLCEDLKTQDKLTSVGGPAYVATLAQYAGTSAYIGEYIESVKNKSILRNLIHTNRKIETEALSQTGNPQELIERFQIDIKSLESLHGKKIPIITTEERLMKEGEFLKKNRGKKYLGLKVKTFEEFNENFLGLRGLILLAAAPNVGKTALTVQTAIEVLSTENDACLVYISLEMTEEQIFRRMLLNLSGLNFRTFVFGDQKHNHKISNEHDVLFSPENWKSIKNAEKILTTFGTRLQIIDQSSCPYIDAKAVINHVEAVKKKTQCNRAIVIIDYLQVWPTNTGAKLLNENEADKWRIGEMKKIRDGMKDDPVIVISEARKPSNKDESWGGDMSDVMGSARGTYTPDVVMLLSQLNPKTLAEFWKHNRMPEVKLENEMESNSNETDKIGLSIKNYLANHGIAICKLEVPKVRDGMQKFSTLLEFHFHKNTFKKVDWDELKNYINDTIPNSKKKKRLF